MAMLESTLLLLILFWLLTHHNCFSSVLELLETIGNSVSQYSPDIETVQIYIRSVDVKKMPICLHIQYPVKNIPHSKIKGAVLVADFF